MEAFILKKPQDVDTICRVCFAENVELFHIFDEMHKIEERTYSQVLSELTMYKIYRHDHLPHQICGKCLQSAREAYLFKRQVEKSYRMLLDVVIEAADFRRIKLSQERSGIDQGVQTAQIAMHVCKLCNSKFFEKLKLRDHFIKVHGSSNVNKECGICHKEFENFRQLYSHMARRHSESIKIECPICKKCFGRRDHMHRHLQNIHKKNPMESNWDEHEIDLLDTNHANEESNHVNNHLKESLILEEPEIEMTYGNLANIDFIDSNQHNEIEEVELSEIEDVNPFESSDDETTNDNPLQLSKGYTISTQEQSDDTKHVKGENLLKDEIDDSVVVKTNDVIYDSEDEKPIYNINEIDLKLKDKLENNYLPIANGKISIVKRKRPGKEPFINVESPDNRCQECQRTFSRRCHLLRHMRSHLDQKPHVCTHCSKHFGRTDHLKKHIISVHGAKDFKCVKCDWACSSSDALERHNALRHGNGEPNAHKIHPCEFCGKMFVSKGYLRKHILMHTDRVYECKICELKFKERAEFREHEKTHVQNYLCSFCGESFVRKDYLTVHMRRHTGEKPYKCKYCDKGFPRATDLNIHERYHIGHKPNLCTLCGKGFHRAYNLTIHMRTHNGEKPYKCDQCPKSFAQNNDLKAHIRRHTGERYKCDNCDAAFLQLYGLRQHAQAAHGVCIESSTGRLQKFTQCSIQPVVQPHLIQPGPYTYNAQYLQQTSQTTFIISNETIASALKTKL